MIEDPSRPAMMNKDIARERFQAHNARLAARQSETQTLLAERERAVLRILMARAKLMNADERHEFSGACGDINPHPKSDLTYASPVELLVAVILSAQTDKSVNLATDKLFPKAERACVF